MNPDGAHENRSLFLAGEPFSDVWAHRKWVEDPITQIQVYQTLIKILQLCKEIWIQCENSEWNQVYFVHGRKSFVKIFGNLPILTRFDEIYDFPSVHTMTCISFSNISYKMLFMNVYELAKFIHMIFRFGIVSFFTKNHWIL